MTAGDRPWWRRRWVTVGEIVAVAGLVLAGLGYWDAHRARLNQARDEVAAQRQSAARQSLVLTATVQEAGAKLVLSPLRPGQAVQSQRYIFPRTVLDHAMEVSAAQPQIDRVWFEAGLKSALEAAARARGGKPVNGEGVLPVGLATSYIEDGETRSDASVYGLGYRLVPGGLFGGRRVVLEGLAVLRRHVAGDLQAAVEAEWRRVSARPLA